MSFTYLESLLDRELPQESPKLIKGTYRVQKKIDRLNKAVVGYEASINRDDYYLDLQNHHVIKKSGVETVFRDHLRSFHH